MTDVEATTTRLTTPERRRMETRARIINAATELILVRGFENVTVEQIAEAAGVSRAAFYLHFSDKAQLSATIGTDGHTEVCAAYRHLASIANPTFETVEHGIQSVMDEYLSRPVPLELGVKVSATNTSFADVDWQLMNELADSMDEHLNRWSGADRDDAVSRVMVLQMSTAIMIFEAIVRKLPLDLASLRRALAGLWFAELTSRP